ncbi:hypothetical protein JTB14_015249 [Gonioctena quinquepunctata]|nr:hypothetical protein JTB14_015249 [Gonioctena quinquepunctata]
MDFTSLPVTSFSGGVGEEIRHGPGQSKHLKFNNIIGGEFQPMPSHSTGKEGAMSIFQEIQLLVPSIGKMSKVSPYPIIVQAINALRQDLLQFVILTNRLKRSQKYGRG